MLTRVHVHCTDHLKYKCRHIVLSDSTLHVGSVVIASEVSEVGFWGSVDFWSFSSRTTGINRLPTTHTHPIAAVPFRARKPRAWDRGNAATPASLLRVRLFPSPYFHCVFSSDRFLEWAHSGVWSEGAAFFPFFSFLGHEHPRNQWPNLSWFEGTRLPAWFKCHFLSCE
jgi:hypothetical protein